MMQKSYIGLFILTALVVQLLLVGFLMTNYGCNLSGFCQSGDHSHTDGPLRHRAGALASKKKISSTNVSIYYETHCPDSKALIVGGLAAAVTKFKDEITYDLVPYGKASFRESEGTLVFRCQHGEKECSGNTFHACAINQNPDKILDVIKFVQCSMMIVRNMPEVMKQCATTNGLDFDKIQACESGDEGKKFLKEMGVKTQAAAAIIKTSRSGHLDFVPSTIIDEKPLVYEALSDLPSVVCSNAKVKPTGC